MARLLPTAVLPIVLVAVLVGTTPARGLPGPPIDDLSDVVDLSGRSGLLPTLGGGSGGEVALHPYALLQLGAQLRRNDTALQRLAGQDPLAGSGVALPHAILGIAGRVLDVLTFEVALDAACGGNDCLLHEAWLDVAAARGFRVRVGRFETPMHRATLVRLAEGQLPVAPRSFTTPLNLATTLNGTAPAMRTGLDVGLMLHGRLFERVEWQLGVFTGEGDDGLRPKTAFSGTGTAVPGLLYAARLAIAPFGLVPPREGGPGYPTDFRVQIAGAVSYDAEANDEQTNDFRAAAELVVSGWGVYLSAEFAALWMDPLPRPVETPALRYWAASAQLGYLLPFGLEPVLRFELFERDSGRLSGYLVLPGGGLNWYFLDRRARLQFFYQFLDGVGHDTVHLEEADFEGLATHLAMLMLQLTL